MDVIRVTGYISDLEPDAEKIPGVVKEELPDRVPCIQIFRDIVKKDEKRLLEEIDKLSLDSKFNKIAAQIAAQIYSLVNSYFNPGQKYKIDKKNNEKQILKIYLKY